ncbi:Fasciclin-domain-containing protein [Parathielavia hyrcaniae]|uniref:Fasciclin-domain-containing protein n=1 Tax=Parathielavia hyrcaniae TaxID=113614 RepID=A0AAN6SZ20_9PEZI|nr:Fasciclin-domain-containing protein [Parathielavia hyrcaniae]
MVLRLPTAVRLVAGLSALLFAPAVRAAGLESVLAGQANLTIFSGLVKYYTDIFANLPDGVTVVAPNDNAFWKLGNWETYNETTVESILKYHILNQAIGMPSIVKGDSIWASTALTDESVTTVQGGQRLILTKQPGGEVVFTSGFATRGTVLVEDLGFDNGLVQVIDSVMRVPESLESTARSAYTDLTAFVGALYAADLMSEVASLEEVTIFAPRNAAFQQLAGALKATDKEQLRRILQYHIVPGNVTHVWELKNASTLATADDGKQVSITRHTNFIFVNSAEIIQTDILLSNGLVHMIDNVLSPDESDARPDVSLTTAQPPVYTLVGATATGTTAPTPFTSDLPCTASCPVPEPTGGGGGAAASTGEGGDGAGSGPSSGNAGAAPARCTGMAGAGLGIWLWFVRRDRHWVVLGQRICPLYKYDITLHHDMAVSHRSSRAHMHCHAVSLGFAGSKNSSIKDLSIERLVVATKRRVNLWFEASQPRSLPASNPSSLDHSAGNNDIDGLRQTNPHRRVVARLRPLALAIFFVFFMDLFFSSGSQASSTIGPDHSSYMSSVCPRVIGLEHSLTIQYPPSAIPISHSAVQPETSNRKDASDIEEADSEHDTAALPTTITTTTTAETEPMTEPMTETDPKPATKPATPNAAIPRAAEAANPPTTPTPTPTLTTTATTTLLPFPVALYDTPGHAIASGLFLGVAGSVLLWIIGFIGCVYSKWIWRGLGGVRRGVLQQEQQEQEQEQQAAAAAVVGIIGIERWVELAEGSASV